MTQLPPDPLYTPPDPEPRKHRGCAFLVAVMLLSVAAIATLRPAQTHERTSLPTGEFRLLSPSGRTGAPHGQPPEPSWPDRASPTLAAFVATHSITGKATYYCNADDYTLLLSRCTKGHPDRPDLYVYDGHDYVLSPDSPGLDLYAAAGPLLRIGDWRGRAVTVFGPADFVVVELIDWCACEGDHLIDLYGDPFKIICGPLATGTCDVEVEW